MNRTNPKPIHWLWVVLSALVIVGGVVVVAVMAVGRNAGSSPVTPATQAPTISPTSTSIATQTPTIRPTSTSIPTQTPTAEPPPVVYRVTWYGEDFRGGPLYCGSGVYGYYDPDDPTTIAAPLRFAQYSCGQRVTICTTDGCATGVIKDRCPGCSVYHLDLSRALWIDLGGYDYAKITIH